MSTVRLRRLQADYHRLQEYMARHPRLQLIQSEGTPPERYQIEYRIRGLRQKDGQLVHVNSHLVEISLPRDYPRLPPLCRMLTPVFHPNIAPHAICIGDHWTAGESLAGLVGRIGEMLAYQSYNTKSPLNGEAARWAEQNMANLPLENVSMDVDEASRAISSPTSPPPAPAAAATPAPPAAVAAPQPAAPVRIAAAPPVPPPIPAVEISCPKCFVRLKLKQQPVPASKFRCPKCQAIFQVSPATSVAQ